MSIEQQEQEYQEYMEENAWKDMRKHMIKWVTKIERPAYLIAEFNTDGTFSRTGNTCVISGPEGIEKLNRTVDEVFEESKERREGTS